MKNQICIILILLSPIFVICQNVEVLGGIKADSINANSGIIKNVANPISAQDAATKAYVDLLETTVGTLEAQVAALQGVKDVDNNRYDVVTIGTQTWMAENLKTTRYNDGTVIPLITGNTAWATASTNGAPGYCWYSNLSSNLILYGALYNWYSINSSSNGNKNVCPTGWHVPTDSEWTTLSTFLGGTLVAGGKMKGAGLAHWISPIQVQQMKVASQGFQAATVTSMEHSTTLASSASGGVLQSSILPLSGTAYCTIAMTM